MKTENAKCFKPMPDAERTAGSLHRDCSATYRLLKRSDAMCPGDERLLDDCKTWEVIEPNNPHIGQRYDGNLFVPMRRRSQNDQAHLSAPGGRVERNQKEQ